MRDYQPNQKHNPYWMERTVYKRVLALVRDYDRMVRDYREILQESAPSPDGQPRSHRPGDPVARRVERMDALWQDIRAVEAALIRIPAEYRKGVMDNICKGGWPVNVPAHINTWSKWRRRFLYFVASNANLL